MLKFKQITATVLNHWAVLVGRYLCWISKNGSLTRNDQCLQLQLIFQNFVIALRGAPYLMTYLTKHFIILRNMLKLYSDIDIWPKQYLDQWHKMFSWNFTDFGKIWKNGDTLSALLFEKKNDNSIPGLIFF